MTDRELLELAAKAAGYKIADVETKDCLALIDENGYWGDEHYYWNPLIDDGDALRLAVNLEFSLHRKHGAIGISSPMFEGYVWESFDNEDNDDVIGTATRRAIVRAAAEIGKEMK